MITLKQKTDIILLHIRDGESFSRIERETAINQKTVSSYIKETVLSVDRDLRKVSVLSLTKSRVS